MPRSRKTEIFRCPRSEEWRDVASALNSGMSVADVIKQFPNSFSDKSSGDPTGRSKITDTCAKMRCRRWLADYHKELSSNKSVQFVQGGPSPAIGTKIDRRLYELCVQRCTGLPVADILSPDKLTMDPTNIESLPLVTPQPITETWLRGELVRVLEEENATGLLLEHGGSHRFGHSWFQRFIRRWNLRVVTATTRGNKMAADEGLNEFQTDDVHKLDTNLLSGTALNSSFDVNTIALKNLVESSSLFQQNCSKVNGGYLAYNKWFPADETVLVELVYRFGGLIEADKELCGTASLEDYLSGSVPYDHIIVSDDIRRLLLLSTSPVSNWKGIAKLLSMIRAVDDTARAMVNAAPNAFPESFALDDVYAGDSQPELVSAGKRGAMQARTGNSCQLHWAIMRRKLLSKKDDIVYDETSVPSLTLPVEAAAVGDDSEFVNLPGRKKLARRAQAAEQYAFAQTGEKPGRKKQKV